MSLPYFIPCWIPSFPCWIFPQHSMLFVRKNLPSKWSHLEKSSLLSKIHFLLDFVPSKCDHICRATGFEWWWNDPRGIDARSQFGSKAEQVKPFLSGIVTHLNSQWMTGCNLRTTWNTFFAYLFIQFIWPPISHNWLSVMNNHKIS